MLLTGLSLTILTIYHLEAVERDTTAPKAARTSRLQLSRWNGGIRNAAANLCRMQLPADPLPTDPAPFGVSIFQWWTQSIVPSLIRCYRPLDAISTSLDPRINLRRHGLTVPPRSPGALRQTVFWVRLGAEQLRVGVLVRPAAYDQRAHVGNGAEC